MSWATALVFRETELLLLERAFKIIESKCEPNLVYHQTMLLSATSVWFLNTFGDDDSTPSSP